MLNYETLLSNYDDKLTLMQWLKKVEDALKDASAVSFDVVNLGNATFKFKIVFEDGSEIESDPLVINQGDSVASAAIVNGDLILTLTNGDTIDAGNMFDGNVNITGTLDVGGNTSITGTLSVDDNVTITGNVSQQGDYLLNGDLTAGIVTGSKLQSTGHITASGAVTARTLEQSEANLTINSTPAYPEGIVLADDIVPYVAMKVINGILWLVCMTKLKNEGANAFSGSLSLFPAVSIPQTLANKIYRLDGTKVSQAYSSTNVVCFAPAHQDTNAKTAVIGSYSANTLNVYISSVSIAAGYEATFSFRIPIVLL